MRDRGRENDRRGATGREEPPREEEEMTTRAASRFSRCLINSSSRGQKCTAKYAEFSVPEQNRTSSRHPCPLSARARARRSTPRSGWPKAPTTRRTTSLTRTTGTVSDVDVRGARKASRRGPRCIATVPGKSHRSASRRRPREARTSDDARVRHDGTTRSHEATRRRRRRPRCAGCMLASVACARRPSAQSLGFFLSSARVEI